ncbi:MAG: glycosyltransferase [Bacteroidales bacterium]
MKRTIAFLVNTSLEFNVRAVKTLKSLAKEFEIVVFQNGEIVIPDALKTIAGIDYCDISHTLKGHPLDVHLCIGNDFFHARFVIEEILSKKGISLDCVYVVDFPTLKTGWYVARKAGAKLVYDSYELYVETLNQYYPIHQPGFKKWIFHLLIFVSRRVNRYREARLMRKVDLLITTCKSYLDYFYRHYQVKQAAIIRNTPEFVDYADIKPVNLHQAYQIPLGKRIVLYIGTFNAGRSLDKLVLAGKYLDEHTHILLLGFGSLRGYLEELIKAHAITNVTIAGPFEMQDTLSLIKGAELGVLFTDATNLSKYLSSANKVFDYMMAGVPVLLSDTPENSEMLEKVGNGVLISELSVVEVATKIKMVLNSEKINDMKMRGLVYSSKEGNWAEEELKLLRIIRV